MPNEREEFVNRYGAVYERSPWIAEKCFEQAATVTDAEHLAEIFQCCVDGADDEAKLELIRSHPDLAGRAAVMGELDPESTQEQANAGIDRCTSEEFARFQDFNSRYKAKFGFPFVMAVRNSNRHEILAAFEVRLDNSQQREFSIALQEIHKIARLRLAALAKN